MIKTSTEINFHQHPLTATSRTVDFDRLPTCDEFRDLATELKSGNLSRDVREALHMCPPEMEDGKRFNEKITSIAQRLFVNTMQ